MVQYVFTPWRDRQELLLVRQQFYDWPATFRSGSASRGAGPHEAGEGSAAQRKQMKHLAVARVSMWMQRGGCPHMVESTALLTAAVLSDEDRDAGAADGPGDQDSAGAAAAATYAVRAAYSAAFSRFVTGLLDGHQDKQRKQSMYAIAKTIGLPATFVELRHQSTHEQLPSLAKLRSAAKKALAWIWDYYWQHLGEDGPVTPADPCTEALLRYLREGDEGRRRKARRDLDQWDRETLLKVVDEQLLTLQANQLWLRCQMLKTEFAKEQEAMAEDTDTAQEDASRSVQQSGNDEQSRAMPAPARSSVAGLETGWSRHEGPWKPKPIGVV